MTTMTVHDHAGNYLHGEICGPADDLRVSPLGIIGRAFATVREWQKRARLRAHLLELDSRLRDDIGMSRADVHIEASKPFWRA